MSDSQNNDSGCIIWLLLAILFLMATGGVKVQVGTTHEVKTTQEKKP